MQSDMESLEMDLECRRSIQESKALAGIFQSIGQDCKSLQPAVSDFLTQSSKLESQIRSTLFAFSTFLDSFQQIANRAANTRGSSRDIGDCLSTMISGQKTLEEGLRIFANSINTKLIIPLKRCNEDFKRKINVIEKDHLKEFKMTRNKIKTKIEIIQRLRKKLKRQPSSHVFGQVERNTMELYTKYRELEEQEKQAVQRINVEERTQFCAIASSVQEVITEEIESHEEILKTRNMLRSLGKMSAKPNELPNSVDEFIKELIIDEKRADSNFSSRHSRCASFRSLSSIVSSRSNSPLCISENKASRKDKTVSNEQFCFERNTRSRLSRISLPSNPSHPQNHDSEIPCSSCNSPQPPPWSVRSRPNSCDAYSQFREQSASPSRHGQDTNQSFSTIRRTHSPFRSISSSDSTYKSDSQDIRLTVRPPSAPRKPVHTNKPPVPPPPTTKDTAWPVLQIKEDQGAVWKKNLNLPNFNFGSDDMIIPDLVNKKNNNNTNGYMRVYETGSTISSTSSGYGSYRTDILGP